MSQITTSGDDGVLRFTSVGSNGDESWLSELLETNVVSVESTTFSLHPWHSVEGGDTHFETDERERVIRLAIRRLIAGRELLGYELANERGRLDEDTLIQKIIALQESAPKAENLPKRVAILRDLAGDDLTVDVVALVTGATWEQAERVLADQFRASEESARWRR